MKTNKKILALPLSLFSCLISTSAFAHFDVDSAGTHESRYGRSEIKKGPCGRKNGTKGTKIYKYQPGETVKIAIDEFISHPGYFRVAFAKDSDSEFVNPKSVLPLNRKCMSDPKDKCGATDFYNFPGVLADNLDPHLRGPSKKYSWDIKMPDVECDNCTLQIIQVMTDAFPIHAPFDPSYDSDDVYYSCIDIELKKE